MLLHGVVRWSPASIPARVVKETGRYTDRWRFSRRQEFDAAPRSVVERTHVRSAQRSARQPSSSPSSPAIPFPPVPDVQCKIWGAQLSLKIKHQWTRDSPQIIREGWRALVALKRPTRDHRNMHKRHLVIGNAVAVMLALSKGRSSSQMVPLCRTASAHVPGSFCQVAYRWVPSDWNGADLPSRGPCISGGHQSFHSMWSRSSTQTRPVSALALRNNRHILALLPTSVTPSPSPCAAETRAPCCCAGDVSSSMGTSAGVACRRCEWQATPRFGASFCIPMSGT